MSQYQQAEGHVTVSSSEHFSSKAHVIAVIQTNYDV